MQKLLKTENGNYAYLFFCCAKFVNGQTVRLKPFVTIPSSMCFFNRCYLA